jgi:hypothetical protein
MIFQALFLSLIAFSLGPRIVNLSGAHLPVDDIRLIAPSDAIPSVSLNRGSKSFPGDVRAVLLGTKVFQSIQLHSVAMAPIRHAPIPPTSLLVGSLLIRAPPSFGLVITI